MDTFHIDETKADSFYIDATLNLARPKIMLFQGMAWHRRLWRLAMLVILGWCYSG